MMTINEEGKALVEQKGFNKEEALKEFMDYVHSYLGDDECDQIMKAFTLADKAHEGQFRASGEPYIMHPLAVAEILAHLQIDHITLIAALLHDVVEDTPITLDDLRDKGYSDEIVVAIDALTRRTDETYSAYIERLSNNKLARRVKIADLQHNLDPERTKMIDNASLQNRYRNALQKLTDIELEENNHA